MKSTAMTWTWPDGDYDQSFLDSGESINCWTNCDQYVDHNPLHRVNKAKKFMAIGYACMLLTPLMSFIICSWNYYQGKFEDRLPWDDSTVDSSFTFWCFYVVLWISCANCGFLAVASAADTEPCTEVIVGYVSL